MRSMARLELKREGEMREYHKIQSIFKRDPDNNFKTFLDEYSRPEFEFLKNNEWVFTEKVDGTNIRVMFDGDSIKFGGKTERAQIPAPLVNRLNEKFLPLKDKFIEIFDDVKVCLYGEGYGAKIQKGGGNYRKDQDFVLFDIKIGNWWLQRNVVDDIALKLGIDFVPVVGVGTLDDLISMGQEGFNSAWGDFLAEGIVARPLVELKARNGERIITKIKYRDFVRNA